MTRSSFCAILCTALLLTALAGTAHAKPAQLTNAQLDRVTAGSNAAIGPIINLPPWRVPSLPPGFNPGGPIIPVGPIINPGGPILISCIIGTGCIVRPYP